MRAKQYGTFLPLYPQKRRWGGKLEEVQLPLLAGYVFCDFDAACRLPILTTPGVVNIVGIGRSPVAIEPKELADLKYVINSRLPVEAIPYLAPNCRVLVVDGPLRGLEGTLLTEKNVFRLVVSITILQRSVAVELDRDSVATPIESTRRRISSAAAPALTGVHSNAVSLRKWA